MPSGLCWTDLGQRSSVSRSDLAPRIPRVGSAVHHDHDACDSIVRLKHLPVAVSVAFLLISGFFDGLLWGASLKKVPLGAWFPLSLAVILCIVLGFWSWAKGLEDKFDASHRHRLHEFIGASADEAKATERHAEEDIDEVQSLRLRTNATSSARQSMHPNSPSHLASLKFKAELFPQPFSF
ncbi:hypothetical protein RQP46_006783 [Phenoliferia psychrophenolica]